jgi:hypothetical protein
LLGLGWVAVPHDVLLVLKLLRFFMSTRTLDLPYGFPAQHRTTGPCSLGTESAQPDPSSNRSLACTRYAVCVI